MIATLFRRRRTAVVFLLLCGAPVCAEAQQYVCWPIVHGDTASRLARRLTGSEATVYSATFQIMDPARGLFVPKSQYSRLSTRWRACVARDRVNTEAPVPALSVPPVAPFAAMPVVASVAPAAAVSPETPSFDLGFAMRYAAFVTVILLMITAASGFAAPRPIPPALQRAGEDFVAAFARPLVDPASKAPPIATRMRFVPRKARLDIGIAPCGRRRYPNLSDHKLNVEYDVRRVLRELGAHRVVCDGLHAEGQWVTVSIRLATPKQAGVK
jgi:hypothetical protein